MLIETTINTHVELLRKLSRAAFVTGRSRQKILSWLLWRIADDDAIPLVSWSRIRYQDRDLKDNWHRLHVVLTPAEYELLLDLKKACKLSGSRIIAYAAEKYLHELLNTTNVNTDNYRFSNYLLLYCTIDKVVCCVQYWGMPSFPLKHPPLFCMNEEVPRKIP